MTKARIYVDMDGVLCDFYSASRKAVLDNPSIAYPQATYGFFRRLPEVEGAVEAFKWLSENFDVWILTRPSVMNPLCYTEKRVWVEEHLGMAACEKLIISPDKALLKGDYLIDDYEWPGFEGRHIHFGSEEFPDWRTVREYFGGVAQRVEHNAENVGVGDSSAPSSTDGLRKVKVPLDRIQKPGKVSIDRAVRDIGGHSTDIKFEKVSLDEFVRAINSLSKDIEFEKEMKPRIERLVDRVHEELNGHDYIDPSEALYDILKFIGMPPISLDCTKEKLQELLDVLDEKRDVAIFKDVSTLRAVTQDFLDELVLRKAVGIHKNKMP